MHTIYGRGKVCEGGDIQAVLSGRVKVCEGETFQLFSALTHYEVVTEQSTSLWMNVFIE